MSTNPNLNEVAKNLIETPNGDLRHLLVLLAERFPQHAKALQQAQDDTALLAAFIATLFEQTKRDCPPLTAAEGLSIIKALNGIPLRFESLCTLPHNFAGCVYIGEIEEPESEPLRREIEEADYDPEFTGLLSKTPPARLGAKIRAMSGEQAFAIRFGAMLWWAHRTLLCDEALPPIVETQDLYQLTHFLNICDR